MAKKRYYLTDNDYEFFIRIFPMVEKLSWFQTEQKDTGLYWHIDFDFEKISKTDKKRLGHDYEVCLQRLKEQVQTVPPSPSSFQPEPSASDYSKKKRNRVKLRLGTVLVDALLIVMILYSINIVSEAESVNTVTKIDRISETENSGTATENKNDPKEHSNFMQLLQKTVNASVEPNNKAEPERAGSKTEFGGYNSGIIALLGQCKKHVRANRLTTGDKGTALDCYHEVLRQSPGNAEAKAGLQKMEDQYVRWAKKALKRKNLKKVRQYLEGLDKVNPESPDLKRLKKRVAALRK